VRAAASAIATLFCCGIAARRNESSVIHDCATLKSLVMNMRALWREALAEAC